MKTKKHQMNIEKSQKTTENSKIDSEKLHMQISTHSEKFGILMKHVFINLFSKLLKQIMSSQLNNLVKKLNKLILFLLLVKSLVLKSSKISQKLHKHLLNNTKKLLKKNKQQVSYLERNLVKILNIFGDLLVMKSVSLLMKELRTLLVSQMMKI